MTCNILDMFSKEPYRYLVGKLTLQMKIIIYLFFWPQNDSNLPLCIGI